MNKRSATSIPELLQQAASGISDKQSVIESMEQLRDIRALFYNRGWSLGTSSNYSVVLNKEPLRLVMTASGKAKYLDQYGIWYECVLLFTDAASFISTRQKRLYLP